MLHDCLGVPKEACLQRSSEAVKAQRRIPEMRSQRVPGRRAGDSKGLTAELAAAGSWDDELTTTGGTKTLATCYIRYTANHKISVREPHRGEPCAVGTGVQWVISLTHRPQGVIIVGIYMSSNIYYLLVERQALAVRLDISFRSVYFFYPGISSEPLNLSQQKFVAKIRKGTAEILWRIYMKFRFLPAIFRVSSTLNLYNFYHTVTR